MRVIANLITCFTYLTMAKSIYVSRILSKVVPIEENTLLFVRPKWIDRHLEWLVVYLRHGVERSKGDLVTHSFWPLGRLKFRALYCSSSSLSLVQSWELSVQWSGKLNRRVCLVSDWPWVMVFVGSLAVSHLVNMMYVPVFQVPYKICF
jgi:hypothetical protein